MEMTLLQGIQGWHTPLPDEIMVTVFNDIVGARGEIRIVMGLIGRVRPCNADT